MPAEPSEQGGLDERVRRVIDLMESQGCRQRVTRVDLARQVRLSVSRLAHLFLRETGMPPLQMMRFVKLRKVAALLSSSQLSVKEIAHAAGFRTVPHLGRLFKVRYGVTPREYRRRAAPSAEAKDLGGSVGSTAGLAKPAAE